MLDKLATFLNGSNFVLRVDLSVSLSFLWLVLRIVFRGQVHVSILMNGSGLKRHKNKNKKPKRLRETNNKMIRLDKVELCYSCIFRGVVLCSMELVVHFIVDSFTLFSVISLVLHSCFQMFPIFVFHFLEQQHMIALVYPL